MYDRTYVCMIGMMVNLNDNTCCSTNCLEATATSELQEERFEASASMSSLNYLLLGSSDSNDDYSSDSGDNDPLDALESPDSLKGELETYTNGDANVAPIDRMEYLMGLCAAYPVDFNVLSEPYSHKIFHTQKCNGI